MKKLLILTLLIPVLLFSQGIPRAGGINNGQAATINSAHNNFVGVQHSNSNAFAVYDFSTTFNYQLGLKTTDDLAEGSTNKYFSTTLARNAFSNGFGLDYSAGIYSLNSTTQGILSSVAYKFDIPTGLSTEYIAGDGSIITFPTVPTSTSQLTNDSGFITSVPAQTWVSITGKPTFANVATSGDYNDLSNKPTISPAQVNTDWNSTSGLSQLLNKPVLATVATSGSYNDLSSKPTIYSFSGTSAQYTKGDGTYGTLATTKRQESYSGTTNVSGNYTVTFGTSYSVAPNIQASITNQGSNTNQFIKVVSVSTTGFTINVFQRSAVTLLGIEVLLAAVTNVPNIPVDVLVTEK